MHARNLPRHLPFIPKLDAEDIAADVVAWFGRCLQWLDESNWTFMVNRYGHYLIGEFDACEPPNFEYTGDHWMFTLRCRGGRVRTPHCCEELTEVRERLHKVVTIVVMNLTSSAKTNKLLADLQKCHKLAKLRKADIL